MKFKFFLLYIFLFTSIILVSCGESEKPVDVPKDSGMVLNEDYYEFQGFSMKPFDIPIMIMLPDETANIGASTKPEVIHTTDDFKWELLVGSNFQMLVDDWGDYTDMVVTRKKELEALDFYKIKYLVDQKNFIMYEQELMPKGVKASNSVGVPHKSYHVYAEKVIDGVTYVFRSKDEGAERLIIELMAKSIKSVKPLKKSVKA
ncbi:hypothetical protein N9E20_02160 [Crocinitomicaceae bacterium]|nr:hypothetical protein [Crocinitomicaceae bacterium]